MPLTVRESVGAAGWKRQLELAATRAACSGGATDEEEGVGSMGAWISTPQMEHATGACKRLNIPLPLS